MPSEAPTINSTRVLRAYRLNAVENVLLRNRVLAMNKEKRRVVRLNNQDIRLIQLTLDYIQSSSGHSSEGRPPSYVAPKVERDNSPYFLYGDRIKSRKYSKQRRAQSAHVSFGRYEPSAEDSASDRGSVNENDAQANNQPKSRPKSSPAIRQRRYGHVTPGKFGGFRPAETGIFLPETNSENGPIQETDEEATLSPKRAASSTIDLSICSETIPELDDKDIETRSLTSQPSQPSATRRLPSAGDKKSKAFVTEETPSPDPLLRFQTPEENSQELNEESTVIELPRPDSRRNRRSVTTPKNSELTKRVNQERVKIQSARKTKPDPMQAWSAPSGSPKKMEEVMAFKGRINESRNRMIQDKLDAFKQQYPTKRY